MQKGGFLILSIIHTRVLSREQRTRKLLWWCFLHPKYSATQVSFPTLQVSLFLTTPNRSMGTFPLLVSLDTRSTIDIDLPSCMSPSSDVFAVFSRILRCLVWHSMSRCHSVTVSRYAMPYHVMSWGLESIYCLSKRLQVFGLTASLLSVCYVLGKQDHK